VFVRSGCAPVTADSPGCSGLGDRPSRGAALTAPARRRRANDMARFIPPAYAGKRSTATAEELHGERDYGEEVHLELLAWLVLVTRSVRAA
jgi:hypothetical protein